MNSFVYENPTRVHFGRGVMDQLGAEVARLGARKVLLVCGGGSIRRNGVYDAVVEQLVAVDVIEHAGVRGNPVLSHVRAGVALAKEHDVDLVCAVGGGSVIDESKAIALGAVSDCDVWDFFEKRARPQRTLPLIAVLTLPATGSEMNGIAVVTNEQTDAKGALVAPGALNPRVSFLDPEATFSLSRAQTAYACTDILSHLMEGYLTTSASNLLVQDPLIEGVARGVIDSMDRILSAPTDYDARAALMWSATLGWNGICQAGIPNWGMPCHALEMPLSALYDIAHGAGLSIVIPAWMRVIGARHEPRIVQFGRRVLGASVRTATDVADALSDYYRTIGAPLTLAEVGVDAPDLERLSALASTSFRQRGMSDYTDAVIRSIYERCVGV